MAKKKKPSIAPQAKLARANKELRSKVPKRMRMLVDDFGGVTAFARAHNVEPKHVYRWLSQGMVPNVDRLLNFAEESGISPEWVLLGYGNPYIHGNRKRAA